MFIAYLNIFKALRLYLYLDLITMEVPIYYLFIMALPVACIAWTVTKEEIFKEAREFCVNRSKNCDRLVKRKFFYVFTCEYCFSHYVTAILLFITKFTLLYPDWRGYIISFFSIVWVANIYMSLFYLLRQGIKKEKATIEEIERENNSVNK